MRGNKWFKFVLAAGDYEPVEPKLKVFLENSKWLKTDDRILFLDGYVEEQRFDRTADIVCNWANEDVSRNKFVLLSSMGGRDSLSLKSRRSLIAEEGFRQTGWTFEEYLKAISDVALRKSVMSMLCPEGTNPTMRAAARGICLVFRVVMFELSSIVLWRM